MGDMLMITGQVLSLSGLLYGWYLTLLFSKCAEVARTSGSSTALLHHLAMA